MEEAGRLSTDRETSIRERDEELALAAKSDPAAFGLLYERHRLSVFRFLRARTTDDEAAADLTAAAFERALAAMPRYRPSGGGVLAWLFRIARNAAIDAARRGSALPLVSDIVDTERTLSPEETALAGESRRALLAAVNRLSEVEREAIVLRYASRLTAREIGAVLGKSEGATQKLLNRALASIRESYRAE